MKKKNRDRGFEVQEVVRTIPAREGEELCFSVVKINGKVRGDIRYFGLSEDTETEGQMLPTPRGLTLDAGMVNAFRDAVKELGAALQK
ncbi:MAG: hypothetical protein COV74_01320 [Candidatus Omnitrophica bacterium CG11_big_fil_rev_8_21_14_0_20_45_26]|uniref:Transcriptional coactivator p15 (PC4) C-terminal domain-containing protein n=1 Tax=Candidatus Abzuiibacterium crystallinum TaxID=1974748 RepID=A0A2H0LRX1_9BACT|nr:MAG: hypothetical protein COV74_01320 [Candidatus Omnitrophica bacterium CG11_big_fil_rev_8_21_14_0_20_45_26]PIW64810.1 MAG: hypothetical protein COW12_04730 [Candidatus Omnitrophica bacterium CG12_big_fil_rev_8_21_14_0_65_45_16]